jgi:hypothetical protein
MGRRATFPYTQEFMVGNILDTYAQRSPAQESEGLDWYPRVGRIARELDPDNPKCAFGSFAAMASNMSWGPNETVVRRAYANGRRIPGGLPDSVRKAQACLDGTDPLEVLGGKKIRAFYASMLEPQGDSVCIDRHAHDIAAGQAMPGRTRPLLGRKDGYETIAAAYVAAASLVGISPVELQAITWVVWRDLQGIDSDGYRRGSKAAA